MTPIGEKYQYQNRVSVLPSYQNVIQSYVVLTKMIEYHFNALCWSLVTSKYFTMFIICAFTRIRDFGIIEIFKGYLSQTCKSSRTFHVKYCNREK